MKKFGRVLLNILIPLCVFVLLLGFWEWMCVKNEIPEWLLPAPSKIFACMVTEFSEFAPHIGISFITVLAGFGIAVPVGILLATLITANKHVASALSPYIIVLVTTPLIILLPLLMLFLGYGIKVRIIGVVLQAFAIVNMNTCTGILNVPEMRHELMQSMGATKLQTLRTVIYPHRGAGYLHGRAPERHLRHHRLHLRGVHRRQRGPGRADHQLFPVSESHRIVRLHLLRDDYRPDHVRAGVSFAEEDRLLAHLMGSDGRSR